MPARREKNFNANPSAAALAGALRAMMYRDASPMLRDRFLLALDADDRALSTELAVGLTSCANLLPGMTCEMLGLPKGSTYGSAACHVLLRHSATRSPGA
jgi:hypothetical protein